MTTLLEETVMKFGGGNVSCDGCGFQNPGAQAAAMMALSGPSYNVAPATEPSLQAFGGVQDRGFGIV